MTFGRGFIIADFHEAGVVLELIEELNSLVMIGASWLEHSFKTLGIRPSGPGPFLGLSSLSCLRTISSFISSGGAVVLELFITGGTGIGFSYLVKKVFRSSGANRFCLGVVLVLEGNPLIFLISVHAFAGCLTSCC